MKPVIFDGPRFAETRLEALKGMVAGLDRKLVLVSVVHAEDPMGNVYTNLKQVAAESVGIGFERVRVSFADTVEKVEAIIQDLSAKPDVQGILIQKPSRMTFDQVVTGSMTYQDWWQRLTAALDPAKDVDCLTRENLERVYSGQSSFLPATARAIISILASENIQVGGKKVAVVGKSELVGKPLASYLQHQGATVELLGSQDTLADYLPEAEMVVSATGQPGLIRGEMLREGVVAIDVGEPKADMDMGTVSQKASFMTPVPGGVGPVTVVSLLENLVELANR